MPKAFHFGNLVNQHFFFQSSKSRAKLGATANRNSVKTEPPASTGCRPRLFTLGYFWLFFLFLFDFFLGRLSFIVPSLFFFFFFSQRSAYLSIMPPRLSFSDLSSSSTLLCHEKCSHFFFEFAGRTRHKCWFHWLRQWWQHACFYFPFFFFASPPPPSSIASEEKIIFF